MALCNSKLLHYLIPLLYFSLIFEVSIFLLPTSSAKSLEFNFPNLNKYSRGLAYEGHAYAEKGIELTDSEYGSDYNFSVGRVVYKDAVHLWDKDSGNIADFSTRFSWIITHYVEGISGDGLAFFLAPTNSSLSYEAAGTLGVSWSRYNSTENHFLAVELDTFQNVWDDVPDDHVGININSLDSVESVKMRSLRNQIGIVDISYNSGTRILSVIVSRPEVSIASTMTKYFLSHEVDLRDHLPEWIHVAFSAASKNLADRHTILSWEFTSSLKMVETGLKENRTEGIPPDKKRTTSGLELVLFFGVCGLIGGFGLVWHSLRKTSSKGQVNDFEVFDLSMDAEFEEGTGPKKFSFRELAGATNTFAEEGKLGEGGFGAVYTGFLEDMNINVAVKKVSRGSRQGKKEYKSEVKIISRLRHKNLVQLIGWCHERNELLLVYELLPNGSLDSHLFRGKSILSWEVRYNIALGLASALLYLHEEWEQCVVHRDIKSSNIMLDSNFNTKLGDFGLARFGDHKHGLETTGLAGTVGYMAPEYINTGKASKESDIFSFGVVVLEIACGRRVIEDAKEEPDQVIQLVAWVWEIYGSGKLLDAVDKRLCGVFNERQMKQMIAVGLWCAHPDHRLRPSIKQAVQVLNFEAAMPNLPAKMPVAMFSAPAACAAPPANSLVRSMTFSSLNVGR